MSNVTVDSVTSGYWGDDSILSVGTWGGLVRGDTVTNSNGALLIIDPDQNETSAIGIGLNYYSNSNFSKLLVHNKSTSAAIIFGIYTAGEIDISNLCEVQFDNELINIQSSGGGDWVSDGSMNQVVSAGSNYGWIGIGYDVEDICSGLWIQETSGGELKRWAGIRSVSADLWDIAGVDDLGRFFTYDETTGYITFGDGGQSELLTSNTDIGSISNFIPVLSADLMTQFSATGVIHLGDNNGLQRLTISATGGINTSGIYVDEDIEQDYYTSANAYVRLTVGGKIPPNGSIIKTPNFGIATIDSGGNKINSNNINNDGRLYAHNDGILLGDYINFHGAHLYTNAAEQINLSYLSTYRYIYIYSCQKLVFDNVISTMDLFYPSTTYNCYLRRDHNGFMYNSMIINENYNYGGLFFEQVEQFTCSGVFICTYNRTSNTYDGSICRLGSIAIKNVDFYDCDFVGHILRSNKNANIYNSRLSNNINALYKNVTGISSYNMYDSLIDIYGLSSIPEGVSTGNDSHAIFNECDNLFNVSIISHPSTLGLAHSPFNGSNLKNCYCSVALNYIIKSSEASIAGVMQGLKSGNIPLRINEDYAGGSNSIYKQVYSSLNTFTNMNTISVYGRHFGEILYDNTNNYGAIGLFFHSKTDNNLNAYTGPLESSIKFYAQRIYLTEDNSSITWTWPHNIVGIMSFRNVNPDVNGSGYANFQVEFSMDNGDNWYLIKDYGTTTTSATFLVNQNFDGMETGFPFKIKMSRVTGSTTEYINRCFFYTSADYDNYTYPLDEVNVVLQNIKEGSEWWVKNDTTNTILGTGTQVAGDPDITIPNIPYNGVDEFLIIRVRQSSYCTKYKPFQTNAIMDENGATVFVSQVIDDLVCGV